MDEQKQKTEQPADLNKAGMQRWQRLLGVVYRLVIILGLLSFALGAVLVIFTDWVLAWQMIFPVLLILIGVVLARVEFVLYKRQKARD
ncbi:MAG TPA: hypothetical protein VIM80_05430 [Brevefilum sp.]